MLEGTIKSATSDSGNNLLSGLVSLVKWFACTFIVFFAAMIVVYCIPVSAVEKNAIVSERYNIADNSYRAVECPAAWSSPNTVQIMLSMTTHADGGALKASVSNPYYGDGSSALVEDGIDKDANRTYERYWNGWMVILKPLLVCFDYGAIKSLLMAMFMLGSIAIAELSRRRFGNGAILACCLAVSFIFSGLNIFLILPFSFSPLLAIGLSIYILSCKKVDDGKKSARFAFFLTGALTAYLDFLITPLMTFAIPCIFFALVYANGKRVAVIDLAKSTLILLAFWGVGYIGLWFSKWVLASIVMGQNVITEGITQTLFRVGAEGVAGASNNGTTLVVDEWNGSSITPASAIALNLKAFVPFVRPRYVLMAIVFIIVIAVVLRKRDALAPVLAISALSISPFVWYILAPNHSIIHYYFTFRLMCITFFGVLVLVMFIIDYFRFSKQTNGTREQTL